MNSNLKNSYVKWARNSAFSPSFNPMEISGVSTASTAPTSDWVLISDTPVWSKSNHPDPRSLRFSEIQQAIFTMASLPDDHDFHLDKEAADHASEVLAVIAENFAVSPPKVMPQDGDSVVFTWDYGDLKRYLTVEEDDLGVMDLHKKMRVRCVHDLAQDGQPYEKLVHLIGANPISATTSD